MNDDVDDFARLFTEFLQTMQLAARAPASALTARIRDHLGVDLDELPVTTAELPVTSHPNLQLALDALLADAELLGYRARHMGHLALTLGDLLAGEAMTGPITPGPPKYAEVEVGDGRVIRCVTAGVYLGRRGQDPFVVSVTIQHERMGGTAISLELLSPRHGVASEVLADLRTAMVERNVYRGRMISLHGEPHQGGARVAFHTPPHTERDRVILPAGTLERIERHAIGMVERADRLRAAGRHLKRGILLHGPPGTGKTLTISYLLTAMPGRTVVLLTGRGLGFIEQAIAIGRELAPATVIFEDVDLVAGERMMYMGDRGGLFELLNQMEGLADDEDLLFLLTSNRPDLLEPALAARPGRVDLAVEIPLPGGPERERLLELYLDAAQLRPQTMADLVVRTEGTTGAFIRELVRQAALSAALDDRDRPGDDDLTAALDELLADRSAITRKLLGQGGDETPPPGPQAWIE